MLFEKSQAWIPKASFGNRFRNKLRGIIRLTNFYSLHSWSLSLITTNALNFTSFVFSESHYDLSLPLHYIGFKDLFDPFCGDSSSDLQAAAQFWNFTSHCLLSAFILKQARSFLAQLLMHFCTLVCSAIEMPEKEKIKKYKTMTKHEIRENILNRFIMPPPLIYRYVSQIIKLHVFKLFWTNQVWKQKNLSNLI